MKNQHVNQSIASLFLVALFFFICACSSDIDYTDTRTATVTPIESDGTAIISGDSTEAKTPTPTEFGSATRTTMPTLPAELVETRVLGLLETNSGCFLPCWWGIKPGSTNTDEIQSILEPFLGAVVSDVRYKFSDTGGHLLMRPQTNGLKVGIQYLAKNKIISMIYINTEMTKDVYYRVYDDPLYQEIMSAYTLESILTKYGKPNQVFIRSFSDLAGELNPAQILLYYPDQGIIAQYFTRNLPTKDKILLVCPPQSLISLRLFDPSSNMSLDELLRLDDSFSKYKAISEATDMDVDTFVQTYREYNEKTLMADCPVYLQTPEEIWPNEYRNP